MDKICLCFFGVIPRSIKYTIKSIEDNIIKQLQQKYIIDIFVFNLNVENTKVDGNILNQRDVNLINYTFYEEEKQSHLDIEIKKLYDMGICKMRYDYSKETIINSIRQMYSEYKVGCFLERNKDKYKGAVICGPDYYIVNKLDINTDYFSYDNAIFTTRVNDAQGITNGFYIGTINSLVPVLKRYNKITEYLPTDKDYENIVKRAFDKNNIICNKIGLLFVKIRSSKKIARQGIFRMRKYDNTINTIYKIINNIQ
jgi:hypothetical protein